MPPDHGFQSIGHILHNIDLRAAFDRLATVTAESEAVVDVLDEPACPRCRDVGLLRRDVAAGHPEFGQPIECPCGLIAARRGLRIWEASQIPAAFKSFTLDSYAALSGRNQLVSDLREWQASDRWLLLTGDVGVGKTGIAVSILIDAMRHGSAGLYVTTPMFLSRLRATYREQGEDVDEMAILASVTSVPLLVLDELGVVRLSEWGMEKIWTVINERWLAGRRTIVTSNLRIEDGSLEAYLGTRTLDRIRGLADIVTLNGSSLRGLPGSHQRDADPGTDRPVRGQEQPIQCPKCRMSMVVRENPSGGPPIAACPRWPDFCSETL